MDLLALFGRVVLSLALVLAVLWFAARGLRRGQRRSSAGVSLEVLARAPLAQRSSVAIVQVGQRALVLGVTESRIELLSEHPLEDVVVVPPIDPQLDGSQLDQTALGHQPATGPLAGSLLSPTTWRRTLRAIREMTVRG